MADTAVYKRSFYCYWSFIFLVGAIYQFLLAGSFQSEQPTTLMCQYLNHYSSARLIFESPHWLQLRGRTAQALKVLGTMARWNKCDTGNLKFKQEDFGERSHGSMASTSSASEDLDSFVKGENCCHIWYYRRLLVRFLVLNVGW